ncbi:MAG: HAD hydrolase family protein [bacterium]
MDIDGVLTDGRIVFCKGEEIKYWNVKDRIAFFILNRAGYKTVWISGRKSREVEKRAGDLKIKGVFLGVKNKLKIWKIVLNKFKIKREEILYIGDDLVDLPLLKSAGLSAAPADAADDIRKICDIVTRSAAGEGVLREITEFVLKTQNKWKNVLNYYAS